MAKFNWDIDKLSDIIGTLQVANELWDEQAFRQPNTIRTNEILKQLYNAKEEIEALRNEIMEAL